MGVKLEVSRLSPPEPGYLMTMTSGTQRDQYTMVDPTKLYADIDPQAVEQDGPGLDSGLRDKADLGEDILEREIRLRPRLRPEEDAERGQHERAIETVREESRKRLALRPPPRERERQ